jgi:hypothetical protein
MKRFPNVPVLIIMLLLFIAASSLMAQPVDIDWTLMKQFHVADRPLDIAISADGSLLFVLTPGKIAVYSNFADVPFKQMSFEEEFDRMTYSDNTSTLILTNAATQTVKILEIDLVQKISTEGSPVKGPENAPVTLAVFDDYQ